LAETFDKLQNALDLLVGQPCTRFAAGGSAGSTVLIDFTSTSRPKPDKETDETRLSILAYCSWRLDSAHEVICGAWDDNSPGGTMLKGLQRLVGKRLISFVLEAPGLDVNLQFEGDLTLKIFCDQVNEVDCADNYILYIEDDVFVVGTKSCLRVESEA
jgi:hypothetical protein